MARWVRNSLAVCVLLLAWGSALAAGPGGETEPAKNPVSPESSIWDYFPPRNIVALLLAGGIIAVMVYWMRAPQTNKGFTIHVDEEDISFNGNFPSAMEATVIEFLRNDCQIPGSYKISGHWEERLLIVAVRGEQAQPLEQRIRNFLKLNLRPPVK